MATPAGNPFPSSSGEGVSSSAAMPAGAGGGSGNGGLHAAGPGGTAPAASEDLLGRVVQGAHETIDRLAERAAPHVHRLQEGVSTTQESLQARAGQLRDTGDEWAESLRCTVRDNPLAAVATALAVGVLIAKLTS